MQERRKSLRRGGTPAAAAILEVRVIGVLSAGLAEVVADDGWQFEARLPQHVDARWLRVALSVGPVDGAVALVGPGAQNAVLWCVLPGPEHRCVMPDLDLRGRHIRLRASESVDIECGRTALRLDPSGNVRLRGQNVACEEDAIAAPRPAESKKALPN
jgi:hypothetical protein